MAFMPFYIIKISPYKPPETMVWIGLIAESPPTDFYLQQ